MIVEAPIVVLSNSELMVERLANPAGKGENRSLLPNRPSLIASDHG
jgi:hypothetical protein